MRGNGNKSRNEKKILKTGVELVEKTSRSKCKKVRNAGCDLAVGGPHYLGMVTHPRAFWGNLCRPSGFSAVSDAIATIMEE